MGTPNIQILKDDGQSTVVKVTGTTSDSGTIVTPSSLKYANSSQTCLVSISSVSFSTDSLVTLTWAGSGSSVIYNFGYGQSGVMDAYVVNNATSPTGAITISTTAGTGSGAYSLILKLNKEQGFANAYTRYNAGG